LLSISRAIEPAQVVSDAPTESESELDFVCGNETAEAKHDRLALGVGFDCAGEDLATYLQPNGGDLEFGGVQLDLTTRLPDLNSVARLPAKILEAGIELEVKVDHLRPEMFGES